MKTKQHLQYIFYIVLISSVTQLMAQSYSVEKIPISTNRYDEYSPVQYKDDIIFCSNRKHDILVVYANAESNENFNIWHSALNDSTNSESAKIFSKELMTNFNDGPVTFNPGGTMIFYSRNQNVDSGLKDISDPSNKLGLYSATLIDGTWSNITPFIHNSPDYSLTTPALSPDGKILFFASDMPGGSGGADLYYCILNDNIWGQPVNLGPVINSEGNESYPFISELGELYFASDGHGGLGKKDIYITKLIDSEWLDPVHLDPPINSRSDDFGLITDKNMEKGYFSSDRDRSDDIYRFDTEIYAFYNCDSLQKNYYCFMFYDETFMDIDTLPLSYEWDFGDGERVKGIEVEHCFPGPGDYVVQLNIIDNNTGNTFFTQSSYEFNLADVEQPFITAPDYNIRGEMIAFSGLKTFLPGFEISEYYWDFGDGESDKGAEVSHTYKKKGEYVVQLGVTGKRDSNGYLPKNCVYRGINILQDNQELAVYLAKAKGELGEIPEADSSDNTAMITDYSLDEALENEAVFRVEVLSSEEKLNIDTALFDPLRGKYDISEVYHRSNDRYSYTVGEAESLMETFPIYNDVLSRGYDNASVKSYVLADLAEEEILELTNSFGEFSDAYFEFNDYQIGEASYPILNSIVEIMNKYPGIRLEIAAHTDNMGSFEYNMNLSQRRAQSMVEYLVAQGIPKVRLVGKGYGESRPIAGNNTEEGRSINRRVEFIILDE